MIREQERRVANGLAIVPVLLVVSLLDIWWFDHRHPCRIGLRARRLAGRDGRLIILVCSGLFNVAPERGRVLQLFGAYLGTVKDRACAG